MGKKVSNGKEIQRVLQTELKKCTPYVISEASMIARYDMACYITKGNKFIVDPKKEIHCVSRYRRKYCNEKFRKLKGEYRLSYEDQEKIIERELKEHPDWDKWQVRVPTYIKNGMKYQSENGFRKGVSNEILCEPDGCKLYEKQIKEENRRKEEYGFMHGLHIFEIKSDKDDHSRLIYQIPNMMALADYVWLVVGENQTVPDWFPPFISVMRHKEDGSFEIEHHHKISIRTPTIYNQVFENQDTVKIKNSEVYAFARLNHKWKINSMFHFHCIDEPIFDMSDEIIELLNFLRRFENKSKNEIKGIQTGLFKFSKE